MTEEDQTNALVDDLHRVLDRYADEFDISVVSAIGALETVKLNLFREQWEDLNEEGGT